MAAGIVPVDKVVEDDTLLAIRDINPRAPVHVLIIPKEHIASARELTAAHSGLLSSLFTAAAAIAKQLGVFDSGYRLTFNVGDNGGQTIYHLHLHLMGGRRLGPEA